MREMVACRWREVVVCRWRINEGDGGVQVEDR